MISILMPVRNGERYLADCLDSIIEQSYKDWELIIVDDHSEDSTVSILTRYVKQDERISFTINPGTGIIHALRRAYQLSSGDYLSRMDADDLMTEDKLQSMRSLIQISGDNHLITGYVEYFSESTVGEGYQKYATWLNILSETEDNFSEIYKECVIASPCWLIGRSDFDKCGGFTSDLYPEDYDLCFRFRDAGIHIKSVKKVLHLWRDHSSRASRNDPHYQDNRFLDLKMHYFIKSDYQKDKTLVLWGAGKKSKKVAQHLQEHDIDFRWICNNPKKIGKHIYDVIIESDTVISQIKDAQFIVVVANPIEQSEIRESLSKIKKSQVLFFC